jgi:phospholipid/cholesterol/gamma-HCH transport system substrate-binding protein
LVLSEIQLVTDTSVVVRLLIQKTYKNSLKAMLSQVWSDGLMGDKVLTIFQAPKTIVKDNAQHTISPSYWNGWNNEKHQSKYG